VALKALRSAGWHPLMGLPSDGPTRFSAAEAGRRGAIGKADGLPLQRNLSKFAPPTSGADWGACVSFLMKGRGLEQVANL